MSKKLLLILFIWMINFSVKASDASIDFMLTNNYNIRQDSNIWERMRKGFRLNYQETRRVKYYEKMYTKNQSTFNKLMKNAYPYLYFILTEIERFGLPSELALIPIVESNYNSYVVNGAGRYDGIWQFIPNTGASFNLYEDNNINDRRNIVKATNAAMLYLNYLNLIFKQWEVAIGAYNLGPSNMYKAIHNSKQKLGNVDYVSLPLRKTTANYVPKIFALANIIKHPAKFGIELIDAPNKPYFAITHPVNNATVSDIISISQTNSQTFEVLNPQYKNTNFTLINQSQILLPIQNHNLYLANINNLGTTPKTLANSSNLGKDDIIATMYGNDSISSDNVIDNNDVINQIGYNNDTETPNNNTFKLQNTAQVTYRDVDNTLAKPSIKTSKNYQRILIIPKNSNQQTMDNSLITNLAKKPPKTKHLKRVACYHKNHKKKPHYKKSIT